MGWGQPVVTSGKRGRHCSDENKHTNENTKDNSSGSPDVDSNSEYLTENMNAHFGKRPRDVSPMNGICEGNSNYNFCTNSGDLDVLPDTNRLTINEKYGSVLNSFPPGQNPGCSNHLPHDSSKNCIIQEFSETTRSNYFDFGDLKIRTSQPKPLKKGPSNSHRGPRVFAAKLRTAYPKRMSTSPAKKKNSNGCTSTGSTASSSNGSSSSTTSTVSGEEGGYIDIDSEDGADDSEDSIDDEVSTASTTVSVDMMPPEITPPEIVPAIRPSYFPFVPPYINFCLHNQRTEPLPPEIQKHLKWRLSNITPVVVKKTLTNSGFRLLRKTVEWGGHWGRHMKAALFKTSIKDFQKLNHLPGTFQIGRKDRLWRNIQRFMNKFGKEEFEFMPKTFVLPMETKQLKAAWDSADSRNQLWIVKPPALARGTGIRVVNKWSQVPKKKPIIVQSYIRNPYLINDRKFDLRLYVLVTNFHPLKVYIYNDGLVRFAPVKYSSDTKRAGDRFMHLTNYSINKNCELYTQNEDADACEGHKWTLKTLWRHFVKEGKDVDKLWSQIEEIVIKTLICAEEPIVSSTTCYLPNLYNGYELFGFDIILDADLKPWLLEVNISPSLHSSSPLDLAVKGPMIKELLNIVGYHLPPKLSPILKSMLSSSLDVSLELETPVFDKRLYVNNSLSKDEQSKHKFYKSKFEKRTEYLDELIKTLTPDDVRQLILAEDELSQCYNFYRIYPTTSTHTYTPYFELPRYYNMLFDAWETKYHDDRVEAVSRLAQLCREKVHLQVPVNAGSTISESLVTETAESITMSRLEGDHKSIYGGDLTTANLPSVDEPNEHEVPSANNIQNLTDSSLEIDNDSDKMNVSAPSLSLLSPTPPTLTTSIHHTPTAVLDNITNNCGSRLIGSSFLPLSHSPPGVVSSSSNGKTPNSSSIPSQKVADLPKGICF